MLNNSDVTPLYRQMEAILEEKIARGEYVPGQRLPSEKELAQQFGVSVITVKKALASLTERGLVVRKQGKGTFVTTPKHTRDLRHIISFSEACQMNGTQPGGRVLEQALTPSTDELRRKLQCDDPQLVLITRLRSVDGVPMAVEQNWMPLSYRFLLDTDLENRSLFETIYANRQVELASARRTIDICYASQKVARLLEIQRGLPLLLVQSIVYDQDGRPVFVGTQTINAERFTLIV